MLKRENRITLNKEFDIVFKKGKSFYNNLFGFRVIDNNLNRFRLGILLGTKVSKKAVVRNKLKRQIREIIQKEQSLLKNKDLVLIVLPAIIGKDVNEIKEAVIQGFKKLKLYK